MPKKQVRASVNAPDPVAALIAKAAQATIKDAPPPAALDALRRILAHNDAQTSYCKKVGSEHAIAMLRTHYEWKGTSLSSLNSLCVRVLGRKSWGTP